MAKTCPKCEKQCGDTAKFCTQCRHVFDSAPNPTCQRGHPLLPGASVCPICQAQDGRTDTVLEGSQFSSPAAYSRDRTQVENFGARPSEPRAPAPGGRGGTVITGAGPGPANVSASPARGTQQSGRSGTVVVAPPGQSSAPAQTERKIVAVLVTFDTTPSGAAFPIRVGRNRIGRNPESEISVPNDQAMSGTNTYIHFYEGSGSFVISDEHSQNGTFVNGNNIEADSVKLSNYATIRAGVTQFTLMMVHPPVLANPLETEV